MEEEVKRVGRESEGVKQIFGQIRSVSFTNFLYNFPPFFCENVAHKIVRFDITIECPAVSQASTTLKFNVTFFIFCRPTPISSSFNGVLASAEKDGSLKYNSPKHRVPQSRDAKV